MAEKSAPQMARISEVRMPKDKSGATTGGRA